MGSITGAALVSHVPPLVMPERERRALNRGEDTTLFAGLHALRAQRLAPAAADTVVVVDTHWFTTIEHVVSAHERRKGLFTSDELPRGMCAMPYDMPGDPELAHAFAAAAAGRDDTWVTAIDDPNLPVHYPTINLLGFLQGDERWVSMGVCQTAESEDFLLAGELLAEAVAGLDRRVVILASGGLSHRFWPLRQFRDHEGADPDLHIRTPEAAAADRKVAGLDGRRRPRLHHRLSSRVFPPRPRGLLRPLPDHGGRAGRRRMHCPGHPVRPVRVGVGHRPSPRMVRPVKPSRQALVLAHEPPQTSVLVGERLAQRGYDVRTHVVTADLDRPNDAVPFPDFADYDVLVPMGSIRSLTNTDGIDSWIFTEVAMVQEAHRRGMPILGICFGGQLLATAFGGSVEIAPVPEIGWYGIHAPDDSANGGTQPAGARAMVPVAPRPAHPSAGGRGAGGQRERRAAVPPGTLHGHSVPSGGDLRPHRELPDRGGRRVPR